MEILDIMYIGANGTEVRTTVNREQYEKTYKPKGWIINPVERESEDENIPLLKTATKIKNYTKMINTRDYEFNDGLFKKE